MLKHANKTLHKPKRNVAQRTVAVAKRAARAVLHSQRADTKRASETPQAWQALKTEHEQLTQRIATLKNRLAREHSTAGYDVIDHAARAAEQETTLALRRLLEARLRQVERAIARAKKGAGGVCERCNQPIPQERLKILPSTTLCVKCAPRRAWSARRITRQAGLT